MKKGISLLLLFAIFWCATYAMADDVTLSTLWPVFDYRASSRAEYQSLHLFGPFMKYETKKDETEFAVRPFFYRASDSRGASKTDVLYPLFGHKSDREATSFHLLHLLSYDHGLRETGSRNQSYLFPFLFFGEEEQGRYMAFFPFGGTLYNWYGRERITFALFPLYSHTERKGTQVDNILWPFFARISGENETGYKFWPLFGESSKQDVYQKKFFLWPFYFRESVGLDSDNPTQMRAFWPFFVEKESLQTSYRALLWPFFSKAENRTEDYQVWNLPWPFVRVTTGEKKHGLKILPFFADETIDVIRQRWYLWPVYKIEEMSTPLVSRRRDRILFFLYSDLKESKWDLGEEKRRIDFWPLFSYKRTNGVSHLHLFSLLEPFFPENQSIERLWAPLWRIYQQKWDHQGNHVVSLFWNLFWRESQGDMVAWELFPLIEYSKEAPSVSDVSLLKGLISFREEEGRKSLKFFYLPSGFSWDSPK